MKGLLFSILAIVVLIILAGLFWVMVSSNNGMPTAPTSTPESQSPPEDIESHSYKGVSFVRPNGFGLAVNSDQLLLESNIPPCTEGFHYCLYYNGGGYENTNFESAGVRIFERSDLANKNTCLNTQPEGFSNLTPEIKDNEEYGASLFTPIQISGAGHSSTGKIYRLFVSETCFEIETRIGITQLENYEPGAVSEFTEERRANLENQLENIIDNIRLIDNPSEPILTF